MKNASLSKAYVTTLEKVKKKKKTKNKKQIKEFQFIQY